MGSQIRVLLLFLLCFLWNASTAYAVLKVEDVRFGKNRDQIRFVLEVDQQTDFRAFVLQNPYRVVLDVPELSWNGGQSYEEKAGFITGMRSGSFEKGLTRIVLDSSRPVEISKAFTLPPSGQNRNRVVLDLKPVDAVRATAVLEKTYGALEGSREVFGMKTEPESFLVASAGLNFPMPQSKPVRTAAFPMPPPKPVISQKIIVIDPGHGGKDPGAVVSRNVYEKHITLAMAKKLKQVLEGTRRYKVILTRDRDKYIKLYDRFGIARKAKADLFISLHADAIDNKSVRGASVYTLSETASDEQTAKLAASENKADLIGGIDMAVHEAEVADILIDLVRRETMNESSVLAETVVASFKNQNIRTLKKSHRQAGFAVLKAPDIPSILIELGFLSNKYEARLLQSASFQEQAAEAILGSIDRYFIHRARINSL